MNHPPPPKKKKSLDKHSDESRIDVYIQSDLMANISAILSGKRVGYKDHSLRIKTDGKIIRDMTEAEIDEISVKISEGVLDYIAFNYGKEFLDANALKIAKEEFRVQESTSRKWHRLALRFFAGVTLISIILIIILILL